MRQRLDPRRIEVIDDATVEMLRRQSGRESVAAGLAMFRFAVQVLTSSVREQHPDWSPPRVEKEAARRLHGHAA